MTHQITIGSLYFEAKQNGWKPSGGYQPRAMTAAEIEERKRRTQEAQEKDQREAERAIGTGLEIWRAATPLAQDNPNPYMVSREVSPVDSLKEIHADDAGKIMGYAPRNHDEQLRGRLVVVPLKNRNGIAGVELIDEDGRKTVPYGTAPTGAFWCPASLPQDGSYSGPMYLGEGVATMLTAHAILSAPCVAARVAGNLLPVSAYLRERYPQAALVILGERGGGFRHAEKAARASGAKLATFDGDANDEFRARGADAVRSIVEQAATPADEIPATAQDSTPKPQPLPEGLPPVKPFSTDLMPDSLRPWVADICERLQCPGDFVGVAVMVGLGAVIGRRIGIRPQEQTDWTEYPNLWGCIVGRPSVMKSPALDQGQAPLRRLAAKAADAYAMERELFEGKTHLAKLKRETADGEIKKRLKTSINANVDDLQIPEPEEPKLKRYIANDTSYESLGALLQSNPNGLLVFRDELVSLLKTLDREDNAGARGFYLTGWAGNSPYTFDRITRQGAALDAVCLSLLGSTQPGRIAEYIRAAVKGGAGDDGLMQRFGLLVWPDTDREWKDVDRTPDTEAARVAFEVFDRLDALDTVAAGAQQDVDINGNPRGQPFVRFDRSALAIFREWREAWENRLTNSSELPALDSHFAKYRKLVPALALICHLADNGVGSVSRVAVLRALAWAEYLESHARRAYASLDTLEHAAARAIIDRLRKGDLPHQFQARDVYRKQWAHLSDRHLVLDALELLTDLDWLSSLERPGAETGGRPGRIYIANPRGLQ